jgi:hypothetical protein
MPCLIGVVVVGCSIMRSELCCVGSVLRLGSTRRISRDMSFSGCVRPN